MEKFTPAFCNINEFVQSLCSNLFFLLFGFNPKELNKTLLPVYLGHVPAGSATDQLIHYGQEINSGRFCQFDYGLFGNIFKYGLFTPPSYALKKVTAPVYIFYSSNDLFVSPIDVSKLSEEIPNLKLLYLVQDPLWTHTDYMFGIHAKSKVYNKILRKMKIHSFQHG